jgi:hypothetical protein
LNEFQWCDSELIGLEIRPPLPTVSAEPPRTDLKGAKVGRYEWAYKGWVSQAVGSVMDAKERNNLLAADDDDDL